MNKGFWEKFNKKPISPSGRPIMCLAPMADITDAAFRRIIVKCGKPDVIWTEMTACDGLCSSGKSKLMNNLWYSESERPIVVQLFGAKPENFYKCAEFAQELGFDGIDINMGCPDKTINKQGAGADLINHPELAVKIIKETRRGAGKLPVSVKTRIGFNKDNLDEWIKNLLSAEPAAITLHARTRKELSLVPARWEFIIRAKRLAEGSETLIIGNGDVKDLQDAHEKVKGTGVDGVMIGRAIFGNPWLFSGRRDTPTSRERLGVMLEHAQIYDELYAGVKSFVLMRKHFGSYVGGFEGAKDLRIKLMEAKNAKEVELIVAQYLC